MVDFLSFMLISRYKFEYDGGHIRGAENWQHGEVCVSSQVKVHLHLNWGWGACYILFENLYQCQIVNNVFVQDDEFLNGFLPPLKPPLSKAPESYDAAT